MDAGRNFGIRNAGYFTLRFLRIEKFIPFWAEELDSNTTPVEVGLMNTIKFEVRSYSNNFKPFFQIKFIDFCVSVSRKRIS